MNRRSFLCSCGVALAGGPFASVRAFGAGTAAPRPCLPQAWQKRGIVLEPSEPWEEGNIQNFTTRAEPLGGGRWRIWYSVSGARAKFNLAYAEGIPGESMEKVPAQCCSGEPADARFAIGNLPEGWRPVQGIHLLLKNGRHRLYFWAHGPQIVRYLAAESEDGRRYRVLDPLRPVLYHPSDRAAFGVPSPDGLMLVREARRDRPANEPAAPSKLISNDATNVYQLLDGSFEMYSVGLIRVPRTDPAYVAEDNAAGLVRVIDRYTSEDGLHFENRKRIIQRDSDDPVDQQFYYLSVTHTGQGRVGMLGHYRCAAQTMDLEWCFSQDGVRWDRSLRKAWLARGEPPAPDCFGIYAGNQLVEHQREWYLFYTGTNSAHNGKRSCGRPRQVIMLATTDSIWKG